jgi:hypothetical protein
MTYRDKPSTMDRLLEENPPMIYWRLCPIRRVQVAWLIDDPHADIGYRPRFDPEEVAG